MLALTVYSGYTAGISKDLLRSRFTGIPHDLLISRVTFQFFYNYEQFPQRVSQEKQKAFWIVTSKNSNKLRNSASSFHWLSSSIFTVCRSSSFVPHRWHLLSSPLYDVSDHTNHIFSVRIWSWQHVSVIHCWVEPSLLLSILFLIQI